MKPCVLALGFFDGVHLGHGALLRRTRELADELHLTAAALTFDTHPDTLVRGETVPLLNTADERAILMRGLYGIDEVRTLHFDETTMAQPWQSFVRDTLKQTYRAAYVVCGEDFRFGAGGEGTAEKLRAECEALGIGCDVIAQVRMEGQIVSSTCIRAFLQDGETARAVRFLGHCHLLSGTVIRGQRLGRTLGIPTANFEIADGLVLPKFGVYAADTELDGRTYRCVVNIGTRPTVGGTSVTVEAWIAGFDGDLYGRELRLGLIGFVRPEQKFDSLEELKSEILRNAETVRNM